MYVTHQVALANETYKKLRKSRRSRESFSQTIERLLELEKKDPWKFVRARPSRLDPDEWIRRIEADRDSATVQA